MLDCISTVMCHGMGLGAPDDAQFLIPAPSCLVEECLKSWFSLWLHVPQDKASRRCCRERMTWMRKSVDSCRPERFDVRKDSAIANSIVMKLSSPAFRNQNHIEFVGIRME